MLSVSLSYLIITCRCFHQSLFYLPTHALPCIFRRLTARAGKGWQHLFTAHQPVVLIGMCLHYTQAITTLFHSVRSRYTPPLPVVGWQLAGKERLLTWLEVKRGNANYNTNQASTLFVLNYKVKNKLSKHTKQAARMFPGYKDQLPPPMTSFFLFFCIINA